MPGTGVVGTLRVLTQAQRNAVLASFLGWTLDAFDFFLTTFVLKRIAEDFHTTVGETSYAIALTLAMRPVGAFLFGMLADHWGRRPALMIDILLFSVFEAASGLAPNLAVLLVTRALFGIAMGGEWGVGSSLVMETIPAQTRGIVSGFLQEGYAVGFLAAALAFWGLYPLIGWRGMFIVGALPALLVVYVRAQVEESPVWEKRGHTTSGMLAALRRHWRMALYVILLMSCFNAFSHGTQDLFPTYLQASRRLPPAAVSAIVIIGNVGAILGGIGFGILSERFGRRRAIILAALLALPVIPLWIGAGGVPVMALGAFLMQFMVQGAWGVVPVHLNELSPDEVRGTFPGFLYQLGNFVISLLVPLQAKAALRFSGNYAGVLAATAALVIILVTVLVAAGPERKGIEFGRD